MLIQYNDLSSCTWITSSLWKPHHKTQIDGSLSFLLESKQNSTCVGLLWMSYGKKKQTTTEPERERERGRKIERESRREIESGKRRRLNLQCLSLFPQQRCDAKTITGPKWLAAGEDERAIASIPEMSEWLRHCELTPTRVLAVGVCTGEISKLSC